MTARLATADLKAHAPPFQHNPSAWRQRIPISILAAVGFVIAGYLALYQWRLIATIWDPIWGVDGTAKVLSSDLSGSMHRWLRIPDAALGALAYLGDAVFGLAGSSRRWQYRPWLVLLFGLDVIPLGVVSVILVIAQGAVVGHWCFLCLVTAAISLLLIPLAADEVWATIQYLRRVWQHTHSRRATWDVFWGRHIEAADDIALSGRRDTEAFSPPRGSMWPRVVELMLGVWLVISPFIFRVPTEAVGTWTLSMGAGLAVIVISSLSMWGRSYKAHLCTIAVGVGLATVGYVLASTGSGAHQNHIMVGLLLVMFAILPTDITMPPPGWLREREAPRG